MRNRKLMIILCIKHVSDIDCQFYYCCWLVKFFLFFSFILSIVYTTCGEIKMYILWRWATDHQFTSAADVAWTLIIISNGSSNGSVNNGRADVDFIAMTNAVQRPQMTCCWRLSAWCAVCVYSRPFTSISSWCGASLHHGCPFTDTTAGTTSTCT